MGLDTALFVLVIYLLLMFGIAWYFSRKEGLAGYFINNKRTGLWLLTMATFASWIGAGATVAIVSESYKTGISYGITFPLAIILGSVIFIILSKKIKKAADEYDAYTIVDYFRRRFDKKNGVLALILQIFMIVSVLGTQSIAMASLASVLTGISLKLAFFLAAGVTVFYITIGGLKIDFITDFVQSFIMIFLFMILSVIVYFKVGGLNNLVSGLPPGHLDLFAFAGPLWFFAVIIFGGLLYLGSSTWQRIASSKSPKIARKSFIVAIPFFVIFSIILLLVGLSSRILLPDVSNPDLALFSLIQTVLPGWLVGVGFAAIFAVIMSSMDSEVIAGSTIFYRSLFKKEHVSNRKELLHARLITALFGIAGFSLAFFVESIVSMSLFASYLTITFALPLIVSLYSKRISANSVFYALLFSTLLLIISFPLMGAANSWIIPLVVSIGILIFYDRIFKSKDKA